MQFLIDEEESWTLENAMARRRRPTKEEKCLREECATLQTLLNSTREARRTEQDAAAREQGRLAERIIHFEKLHSDATREGFAKNDEIRKLTKDKADLDDRLRTLRLRFNQLSDAFTAVVKSLTG